MNLKRRIDEKEKCCDFSIHRVSRFIQPGLLLFLSMEPSYGYELIDRLEGLGFNKKSIDIGAIYRNLRKLERDGYVVSSWQKKSERKRRLYRITTEGKVFLDLWVERIRERKAALDRFIRLYRRRQK
ncbi:MAG: hypothetical protein B6D63_05185 [Candidatus Latescibacteria bacterium 4484_7]|nr:MAG: hypothetical protein B6D63_05185 [Candidatus Latescibacteria bacterium 4484_7]